MSTTQPSLRVAIFGSDGADPRERHGCGLWAAGYQSVITAAGAIPVPVGENLGHRSWDDLLEDIDAVVLSSTEQPTTRQLVEGESLVRWAEDHELPILAIDTGMHILNTTYNGSLYTDLPRELPEALQHRHPPERGLRHAIAIVPETRLANLYGEGEVIVNSEHRRAIQRVARGFAVGANALDGVVEAIEAEHERWFCLGVQWHPASATASGLDIQLFRGLLDAAQQRLEQSFSRRLACAA